MQQVSDRQVLEKLVFSNLQEAQAARRWNIGLRLAWLLFAVAAFWLLRNDNAPANNPTSAHTATVEIKGEIASGADASAENIVLAMRSALEDSGSQALVLVINSPGGSPVQAGIINDEIHRLKAVYKNPFMPWWKSLVLRRLTTLLLRPTKFTLIRPASWAASAC